jgi:hypothetical protein
MSNISSPASIACVVGLGVGVFVWFNAAAADSLCVSNPHLPACDNPQARYIRRTLPIFEAIATQWIVQTMKAVCESGSMVNSSWGCDMPRRADRPTETRRFLISPTLAKAADIRTG